MQAGGVYRRAGPVVVERSVAPALSSAAPRTSAAAAATAGFRRAVELRSSSFRISSCSPLLSKHLSLTLRSPSSASSSRSFTPVRMASQENGSTSGGADSPFLTDAAQLISGVDTFVFDCDGVVWKGDSLIDGVPETLDFLRSLGKKLIFVTNNSTKSRKQYGKKFESLGLNVTEEEIFSSSFAAAGYLESINFPSDKKVYVIGEDGILKELEQAGIQYLGGPSDGEKKVELKPGTFMEHDHDVGAVVVGFDRYVNYYKLQYATLAIRENPGCLFIATNLDAVTHLTDAQEWAGGGSMVGAIKGSTKKEPMVVGKPSTFMLDFLANKFNISKAQICMVGDRLDTDIMFGQNGGCKTLLVLSGVTTKATLQSPENPVRPDFYTNQISDFLVAKEKLLATA